MKFNRELWLGLFLLAIDLGYGAQFCPPEIEWENKFLTFQGGFTSLHQISDGGIVVGAAPGFFVARLAPEGRRLWQRYYGGGSSDALMDVQQTSDGGFILAGHSWSRPNGYGAGDFWVVRADLKGNVIWERPFGGNRNETCAAVRQTSDGGFLIGGDSVTLGANGSKSSTNWGAWDVWLVRIDANGNKLWDKTYGGRDNEHLTSLEPTSDGGFILAGRSFSGSDGNKTSPQWGNGDVWIVRVDANGNKLWDRSYGGSDFDGLPGISVTADGGFILASSSRSGVGGTKTSTNFGDYHGESGTTNLFYYSDFWVLRLNSDGQELWQRAFGGNYDDYAQQIRPTADGGFIVGGLSNSRPSGNKTSPNYGDHDCWVLRLDAQGIKLWEASFGDQYYDDLLALDQTLDGGFILAGRSEANPWLIKLAAEPPDCDEDGIPNAEDLCPDTPLGSVVDADGCSIEQVCPCEGPWRNHHEYVKCVTKQASKLKKERKIDGRERQAIVEEAKHSDCGNR